MAIQVIINPKTQARRCCRGKKDKESRQRWLYKEHDESESVSEADVTQDVYSTEVRSLEVKSIRS